MDAIYGGRNGVLGNLRLNVGIYVQLVPLPEAADSASRAPLHLSAVNQGQVRRQNGAHLSYSWERVHGVARASENEDLSLSAQRWCRFISERFPCVQAVSARD